MIILGITKTSSNADIVHKPTVVESSSVIAKIADTILCAFQVKVRFLDLGFVENFQPSSLCKLPPEFLDIPFQVGSTRYVQKL